MKNEQNSYPKVSVMAIINITPDSFYGGSRTPQAEQIADRVRQVVAEGADIIDIGGYSSRPGAEDVAADEEFRRVDSAMEIIRRIAPSIPVSVDTFRAAVARRFFDRWGRFIINDISAGEIDAEMIPLAGQLKLPYIAMHMRGTPQTMQALTDYPEGVTAEVRTFFEAKIAQCRAAGIEDLTLDPGFGFAKTVEQNFQLLRQMNTICGMGYPVLAGLSRKSMIWRTLECTPHEALNGTSALNWEALRQGASILRVHDVREAVEITKLFTTFNR